MRHSLANFSKNIASIERRQIREDTIEPGLAESYKKKNVELKLTQAKKVELPRNARFQTD